LLLLLDSKTPQNETVLEKEALKALGYEVLGET